MVDAGPVLHAEVGDVLEVVLVNNLDFAINLSPGIPVGSSSDGGAPPTLNPGDTHTAR